MQHRYVEMTSYLTTMTSSKRRAFNKEWANRNWSHRWL